MYMATPQYWLVMIRPLTVSKPWRTNWSRISRFFAYTEGIRRVIYTTNAIESLNKSPHKVTRDRNSFPNDEAAINVPIGEWEKIPRLQAKTSVCPEGAGFLSLRAAARTGFHPVERISCPKSSGFSR